MFDLRLILKPLQSQTVRRQALLTVNALAHANVDLITTGALKTVILPVLYKEIKPDEKLVRSVQNPSLSVNCEQIRVVNLGPFKHKIDDGLPLRKAAFQALETLLEVAPHRLDLSEFVRSVQIGLVDHDDIQIVTYQILCVFVRLYALLFVS